MHFETVQLRQRFWLAQVLCLSRADERARNGYLEDTHQAAKTVINLGYVGRLNLKLRSHLEAPSQLTMSNIGSICLALVSCSSVKYYVVF